jgi:hypothetical protein
LFWRAAGVRRLVAASAMERWAMNESSLNLLLLGDPEWNEFRHAVEFLRNHPAVGTIRTVADVSGLRQLVGGDSWRPDLVVACEAWPDQFSESDVLELFALCPLARIVCCCGPWCDSANRTHTIWPLAVRTPAAAAKSRLANELAILADRQPAARVLPLTASRGEIFEFGFGSSPIPAPAAVTAKVISPDRRWREMLRAALAKHGCRALAAGDSSAVDIVLFDADPWDAGREAELSSIRAAYPHTRLIACVGFPRRDLGASLCQAGADNTWFKLAPLQQLFDDVH